MPDTTVIEQEIYRAFIKAVVTAYPNLPNSAIASTNYRQVLPNGQTIGIEKGDSTQDRIGPEDIDPKKLARRGALRYQTDGEVLISVQAGTEKEVFKMASTVTDAVATYDGFPAKVVVERVSTGKPEGATSDEKPVLSIPITFSFSFTSVNGNFNKPL